jgi:hypothetical protein
VANGGRAGGKDRGRRTVLRSGFGYRRGQKLYGGGFDGSVVCLTEARDSLYRRPPLGLR